MAKNVAMNVSATPLLGSTRFAAQRTNPDSRLFLRCDPREVRRFPMQPPLFGPDPALVTESNTSQYCIQMGVSRVVRRWHADAPPAFNPLKESTMHTSRAFFTLALLAAASLAACGSNDDDQLVPASPSAAVAVGDTVALTVSGASWRSTGQRPRRLKAALPSAACRPMKSWSAWTRTRQTACCMR